MVIIKVYTAETVRPNRPTDDVDVEREDCATRVRRGCPGLNWKWDSGKETRAPMGTCADERTSESRGT